MDRPWGDIGMVGIPGFLPDDTDSDRWRMAYGSGWLPRTQPKASSSASAPAPAPVGDSKRCKNRPGKTRRQGEKGGEGLSHADKLPCPWLALSGGDTLVSITCDVEAGIACYSTNQVTSTLKLVMPSDNMDLEPHGEKLRAQMVTEQCAQEERVAALETAGARARASVGDDL